MNMSPLFEVTEVSQISIKQLVAHVQWRAKQVSFPLPDFTEGNVVYWLSTNISETAYSQYGGHAPGEALTQRGVTVVVSTLPDPLFSLVTMDMLVVFQGLSNVREMVNGIGVELDPSPEEEVVEFLTQLEEELQAESKFRFGLNVALNPQ